jgi:hypothetical protein
MSAGDDAHEAYIANNRGDYVPNGRDRAPHPYTNTNIVCVRTILETLNVNSRKTQWVYMRDTIAMITRSCSPMSIEVSKLGGRSVRPHLFGEVSEFLGR